MGCLWILAPVERHLMRHFNSLLILLMSVSASVVGQTGDPASLSRMTSPVEVHYIDGSASSGSGFFFEVLAPPNPDLPSNQPRTTLKAFLITNRHVITPPPKQFDQIAKLVFFLRTRTTSGGVDWLPVELPRAVLGPRLHFHSNPQVDVAAIDVFDLLTERQRSTAGLIPWAAVSRENFPGDSPTEQHVNPDVYFGDDVVIVGYPKLFYDEYNKLPILKRGMLATPWRMRYRGNDTFLLDSQGFHGSSGSLVVSKPTVTYISRGNLAHMSAGEMFVFLGIYSGEPFKMGPTTETDDAVTQEKVKAGLGEAWYYYTVDAATTAPPFR